MMSPCWETEIWYFQSKHIKGSVRREVRAKGEIGSIYNSIVRVGSTTMERKREKKRKNKAEQRSVQACLGLCWELRCYKLTNKQG